MNSQGNTNGSLLNALLKDNEDTWNEGKRVFHGYQLGYDDDEEMITMNGTGKVKVAEVETQQHPEDVAVSDAIRGIYNLWKGLRSARSGGATVASVNPLEADEEDRKAFAKLVERTLNQ